MTREGEIVVLREHLATCERLAATLVNAAWDKSGTLFATAQAITGFVERERLLHGDL